ncbi:uncharacterized protein K452DRAFT_316967 [Aplosporella prunicola CBS 121167]|uniref:RING-type domain-containing protein n=1 Tax=Aplosporella prunicola CBS 121167 TaxID=1176127 RepID=A0A6A6BJR0_9PEZI|nr:uncharacterized protein K452DRAFT_316967 [Aplosporella prunicola CBS 121167]KAF2144266.1 hypothetical protein K452DRAFT_316967 [Aplosporella prunicola CBS 121167]
MAGGLENLEKELSCSICTDVLYQPLTLLDCLHTFCGACLKEWFSWQAASATNSHPYTCPACRASVRATRPDARVTSLLELFLHANPTRGKTEQEMDDMRKVYKPGDNILPKVRRRPDPDEEHDARIVDDVLQLSLEEAGISSGRLDSPRDRRRRERSRDSSDREDRRRRARDASALSSTARVGARSASRDTSPRPPSRHIEHQSSLRSLLSISDFDSEEMETEIMRQIRDEGLLDGIDLENLDVAQEEEISERIAQAFRRRQRDRERARARHDRSRSDSTNSVTRQMFEEERPHPRRQRLRTESAIPRPVSQNSRPPVSRPHLFDVVNQDTDHHRRSSSQGGGRTAGARRHHSRGLSTDGSHPSRPAARSAVELSERPQTARSSGERHRRLTAADRRITDPEQNPHHSDTALLPRPVTRSSDNSPRRAAFTAAITASPQLETPEAARAAYARLQESPEYPSTARHIRALNNSSPPLARPLEAVIPDSRPSSSSAASPRPPLYAEPLICCNRCGKEHIEYELHFNCSKCKNGNYNVCLRCYRAGEGCLHFYGVGSAALRNYERRAPPEGYPPGYEKPHVLSGHCFEKPRRDLVNSVTADGRALTEEDPTQRLQAGVFCDICLAFTNSCYWKCDTCNEGAWGFCNSCVNQGRHCTHPLLPLQHVPSTPHANGTSGPPTPTAASASANANTASSALTSLTHGPDTTTLSGKLFYSLSFLTHCDRCRCLIPPNFSRYHCQACNAGDFDICLSCYHGLVSGGRIAPENGQHGWRRCPRGHRMVVIGFEDGAAGQRRVVTHDLVGGLAFRDEDVAAAAADCSKRRAGGEEGRGSPGAAEATSPTPRALTPAWTWHDGDGMVRKARTSRGSSAAANAGTARSTAAAAAAAAGAAAASASVSDAAAAASASTTSTTAPSASTSATATATATGTTSSSSSSTSSSKSPRPPPQQRLLPPNGGVGIRAIALWGYFPREGVQDELMFPRGAEVREAEDINGDWFWGVYAGAKGLFPGNFVRGVGVVS